MSKTGWVLDRTRKVAEFVLAPGLTLLDLRAAIAELPGVPGWGPDYDMLLVITRESDLDSFTLEELIAHQTFMRGWNEKFRRGATPKTAMVCPDALQRTIPELWSAMNRDGWKTRIGIFSTRQEALRWLGEPVDAARDEG